MSNCQFKHSQYLGFFFQFIEFMDSGLTGTVVVFKVES